MAQIENLGSFLNEKQEMESFKLLANKYQEFYNEVC